MKIKNLIIAIIVGILCVGYWFHTRSPSRAGDRLVTVGSASNGFLDKRTKDFPAKDPRIIQFQDPKTKLIGFRIPKIRAFLTRKKSVIIPARYEKAHDFNVNGLALVYSKDHGWHQINRHGKRFFAPYTILEHFSNFLPRLLRFEDKGKLGFMNVKGDIVIPAQFDWTPGFTLSEPIAAVCIGCKWEKVKRTKGIPYHQQTPSGKWERPAYTKSGVLYDEKIIGGKWGFVDKKGTIVVPLEFTDYTIDQKGTLTLFKDGKAYTIYATGQNTFTAKPTS